MDLTIPSRFAGPPSIAHGGYVAGHFADRMADGMAGRSADRSADRVGATSATGAGAVQVTLRRPTPLDAPLRLVATSEDQWALRHDGEVCADAVPVSLDLAVPAPPSLDEAAAAAPGSPSHFNGSGVHPTCFGCSILREPDDGLRITAGPLTVDGRELVAAAWTPGPAFAASDGRVDVRHVVAALDCPGAFAFMVDGERPGLLGRITYEVRGPVELGETHVVTGWQIGRDGRKLFAGTAIHAADGTCRAVAEATWFVVDWSRVRSADGDGTGR